MSAMQHVHDCTDSHVKLKQYPRHILILTSKHIYTNSYFLLIFIYTLLILHYIIHVKTCVVFSPDPALLVSSDNVRIVHVNMKCDCTCCWKHELVLVTCWSRVVANMNWCWGPIWRWEVCQLCSFINISYIIIQLLQVLEFVEINSTGWTVVIG